MEIFKGEKSVTLDQGSAEVRGRKSNNPQLLWSGRAPQFQEWRAYINLYYPQKGGTKFERSKYRKIESKLI
jgi:hypothetical protein